MAETELSFEGFLTAVDPDYREFAGKIHSFLLDAGCKLKLQTAKNGEYIVSYQHVKSKRVIFNFVFRKTGLVTRIYGDNINRYADFLETLPEKMVKSIEKSSSECKLCNAKCPKGYVFSIRGKQYNRCRYNCFMFPVDGESIPFILDFIENEAKNRNVAI